MIVALPEEYWDSSFLIDTRHEEDALCWLWAFPDIFPWPNPVTWLYTPVVGNTRWPGDLWGIDTKGNLLIVEAKQCKRRDDPFMDFVRYHNSSRLEFSAIHWQVKWQKHFLSEISFPNCWAERPSGRTDGILPRSNKRSHLRRWPELSQLIDDRIRSKQYAENVKRNLAIRNKLLNPTPHYIALMIETDLNYPILTDDAKKSAKTLQKICSKNHIGVIAIHCKITSDNKGNIEARKVGC